jgi:hypothetical protein
MVDAVHERFNIDLHLAVGAWHDFAQALGSCPTVSVGTSSRRFSAIACLIAAISSTSRERRSWLPCSSASGSRCLGSAHNGPAKYSGRLWTALSALHTARFTEQRRKPCRGHGRLTGGLSIFSFATVAVAGINSAYRRCRKQWHRRGRSSDRRSILGFAAVAIGISVGGAARHEQREHQCCDFHDTPLDGFERL